MTVSGCRAAFVSLTEVHRFVAIHGSAAHLALMAMAPLFLYPFVSQTAIAASLGMMMPLALIWLLMQPSVYSGEMPHDARRRVLRSLLLDPLTWLLLSSVVYALVVAINSGVAYVYDVELTEWKVSVPRFPFVTGSVASAGWLPATKLLIATLSALAIRHAYGKKSSVTFLLLMPCLSGLAAVMWYFLGVRNVPLIDGTVCGFALLLASLSALMIFEQRLSLALPLLLVAVAGNLVGLVAFASALVALVMLSLWLLSSIWLIFRLRGRSAFYGGVGYPLLMLLSALVVYALLTAVDEKLLTARIDAYSALRLFDENFFSIRESLSKCARSAWVASPWFGSGLGSFDIDMKLFLQSKDWLMLPAVGVPEFNGWWKLLAECGIVGVTFLVLPLAGLLFQLFRAIAAMPKVGRLLLDPLVVLGPVALLAWLALPFWGQKSLSIDSLLLVLVLLAMSVRTVDTMLKGEDNG